MNFSDFSELAEAIRVDDRHKTDEPVKLRSLAVRVSQEDKRNRFDLVLPGGESTRMTDWAGSQLLQKRLGIPYDFVAERCSPGLAQDIVDQFMGAEANCALMIRKTQRDGHPRVRAVLPGSAARFDNSDMIAIASQVAEEYGLGVQHYRLDEYSFHCRLLVPREMDGGINGQRDPHFFGIHLRNSEVGCGVPEANLTVVRQVCSNGMIGFADDPIFKLHSSSLHSIRKDRLVERFREGLKQGLEKSEGVLSTIRAARGKEVKMDNLEDELRKIHRTHGLSVRNVEIVREAFVRESRDSNAKVTTAFTLASALTRAAQHLPGDDRVKYEQAAWSYLKAHSKN